ncbi:trypsin-like serine peptidase [Actinomadura xylanilytica]|uniref:trypsin-like serine peptidase n=1 Tax=Actinomadura xylanilytica TaxID=887459 RepID=UPI00255AC6CE|nr:hypothetical protein [Actinomadura xylanilytica]MDL4771822.1 hypothetical protein [Actinomadura xylanilytica]
MRTSLILGALLATACAGAPAWADAPAAGTAPAASDPGTPISVRAPRSPDGGDGAGAARNRRSAPLTTYWTPSRMRHAVAADPGRAADARGPARKDTVRTVPPKAAPGRPDRQAAPAGGTKTGSAVPASRATGKVFFRNAANGRDYSCSAAVVNSASGSLISTAGHCVHDSGDHGTWHQNWAFVPDFASGERPYGIWRAEWLAGFTGWTSGHRAEYDVAFVKVARADGRSIVDTVGGNGFQTGTPRDRRLTILGYPFLPPYKGDRQYYCAGDAAPTGRRMKMPCTLTTGTSGGPWLWRYDGTTGLGYVNGISTNTDLSNTTLWSPYLGDAAWNLYRYADRLQTATTETGAP